MEHHAGRRKTHDIMGQEGRMRVRRAACAGASPHYTVILTHAGLQQVLGSADTTAALMRTLPDRTTHSSEAHVHVHLCVF